MMPQRILLTVEYDGTAYAGWQRQSNGLAVQQVLEEALTEVLGVPEGADRVIITGASRTDARVHALGQRCHFDTESHIPPEKYPFVLNTRLPRDIRVSEGRRVPDGFHARFMTMGKLYTYRIVNSRHARALLRDTHVHIPVPLDDRLMHESAQHLLGTHDFAAFQAAGGTANTTIRTIHSVNVKREGDVITLTVEGNAFLYNMVRIIAGTLIGIGQGKLPADSLARAIETPDRLLLGVTAPAHGL